MDLGLGLLLLLRTRKSQGSAAHVRLSVTHCTLLLLRMGAHFLPGVLTGNEPQRRHQRRRKTGSMPAAVPSNFQIHVVINCNWLWRSIFPNELCHYLIINVLEAPLGIQQQNGTHRRQRLLSIVPQPGFPLTQLIVRQRVKDASQNELSSCRIKSTLCPGLDVAQQLSRRSRAVAFHTL